jgi:hypothetical protein
MGVGTMNQIDKTNIRRIAHVLVAVCVALTISASLAAAYVAGETAAVQTERTSDQVDRTNKADSLRLTPSRKPVERDGAKHIEVPRSFAAPSVLA